MTLFLGMFIAGVLTFQSKASAETCDTCDQVYRTFNQICPEEVSGCGACGTGFEEHADNACHYVWNVSHNSNASIEVGNSVNLTCHFKNPENCLWYINTDTLADIAGRYRYINGNGIETHDCSIQIRSFEIGDVGKWACKSMATSSYDSTLQSTVWLGIINKTNESESLVPKIEVKQLKDYGGNEKETYLWLECGVKSRLPVTLHWTVNGNREHAIASMPSEYETRIFLKLPIPNEKHAAIKDSVLACSAEYPNINQHFKQQILIATLVNNSTNPQMLWFYVTTIIVIIATVLGSGCAITAFIFHARKNTKSLDENIESAENTLINEKKSRQSIR